MTDALTALIARMAATGATGFLAKELAPNDNSKNQLYLGSDFGVLNILPQGGLVTDTSDLAGSRRDRAKAPLIWDWLLPDGLSRAPDAQLILYPAYPEVRLSGLLRGADGAPADVIRSRAPGRMLFLGVVPGDRILAWAGFAEDPEVRAFRNAGQFESRGVFSNLGLLHTGADARSMLIARLAEIADAGWLASQKLGADGPLPYRAPNGGGYTLEAALGIRPNGRAAPDFHGWEIKQFGVSDFMRNTPRSAVTLMTPEPAGGFYREAGAEAFVRRYGYPDRSGRPGRLNFGGVYTVGRGPVALTGLSLEMDGFDPQSGRITDIAGGLSLKDTEGRIAASWSYTGLIAHWNRKHAQACYVPSVRRGPPVEYAYGREVLLCEGTDFFLLLRAFAAGIVSYDPALKLENRAGGPPALKRRSQFRIRHRQVTSLYRRSSVVRLPEGPPAD